MKSDTIELLKKEVERLERERDHWLSEAQRILRSGQDALDKLKAAERRLAEQGQAQFSPEPDAELEYLLVCVESHIEKFPVPGHMRNLIERIRARHRKQGGA